MAEEKESAIDRLKEKLKSINKESLSNLRDELEPKVGGKNSISDAELQIRNNAARMPSKGGGAGGAGVIPGIKGGGTKSPNFEMKKGGKVSSASARADGCCIRGKTRA